MADNVTITNAANSTPPAGTIIATDEASDNSQMQIVKLAIATGGSKTLIPADASGLLVNLGTNNDVAVTGNLTNISGTISLPTGAATSANQTAANASLDAIETAVEGTLTVDGSGVTQPVSGTVTANLSATDNAVLDAIAADTARLDVVGGGAEATALRVTLANNSTGLLSVDDNGGSLTVDGSVTATLTPTTTGAAIFRSLDLDETEEQVSATAASLYGYYFYNAAATVLYLKFYNLTAANTTVGTSVPVMTLPLPAGQAGHISFPVPVAFSTAMTVACVTEAADSGTTGAGTGECILNVFYDN